MDLAFLEVTKTIQETIRELMDSRKQEEDIEIFFDNGASIFLSGFYLGDCGTSNWKYYFDVSKNMTYHIRKDKILYTKNNPKDNQQ